jgi:hypothetical protein
LVSTGSSAQPIAIAAKYLQTEVDLTAYRILERNERATQTTLKTNLRCDISQHLIRRLYVRVLVFWLCGLTVRIPIAGRQQNTLRLGACTKTAQHQREKCQQSKGNTMRLPHTEHVSPP